jgi:ankyrin repeat protein
VWEPPPFDESPLHAAAMRGRADVLELLLDAGGRDFVNTFSYLHETPLTAAARLGHVDAVRVLLEADSDVNAHDENNVGNTALQESVEAGFEPVVTLLLLAGANPNIRGWMQLNAVDRAGVQYERCPDDTSRRILVAVRNAASRFPDEPLSFR